MIETIVDKQNDLTIHKCSGVLTEKKLLDKIQTFYDSNPTLYTLWDFSHAVSDSISQEAVRKMLALVQRVGPRRRVGQDRCSSAERPRIRHGSNVPANVR